MIKRKFLAVTSVVFFGLCLTPRTFADNMLLTSPGSTLTGTNVLDGVYVGAYTATINGVSTPVVCDDYADESYVQESWTATSMSLASSNLGSTMWNSTTGYEEAAWLIEQMSEPSNASQIGEIQFAIWGVFNSTAISDLTSYNTADGTTAQNWLNQAMNVNNYTSVDLADFTIYTPTSPSDALCNGGPCAETPPQEFMTYSTPEPPFFAIFGADLLLFGLAVVFLRRRGILRHALR